MSSHWFSVIFPLVQIGCCDNIGFGFTTLNRKAPYKLLFHTSFTVNNSCFELLPFNNWCLLLLIPPLDRLAFVMDTLGKNSFAFPPVFHSPFLCSDFLSTLWASVHVISVQCVFDRHFVQWFLDNKIPLSVESKLSQKTSTSLSTNQIQIRAQNLIDKYLESNYTWFNHLSITNSSKDSLT